MLWIGEDVVFNAMLLFFICHVGQVKNVITSSGLIWAEIRALWTGGLVDYISDLWNIVDFITNMFYIAWISLRISAWYIVQVNLK